MRSEDNLLGIQLHSDNFIFLQQIDSPYAHGNPSGASDICLMEADTLSKLCHKNDVFVIIRKLHFDQLIFIAQSNRCQACLSDILILLNQVFFTSPFFVAINR